MPLTPPASTHSVVSKDLGRDVIFMLIIKYINVMVLTLPASTQGVVRNDLYIRIIFFHYNMINGKELKIKMLWCQRCLPQSKVSLVKTWL